MSGYLGVFTIDINAVWPPEGTVYGQMAKQFAVRSELRQLRFFIYVTAGRLTAGGLLSDDVNKVAA